MFPLMTAEVPPETNWMRLAAGRDDGVGGNGVGGTVVGGTAVDGMEVTVTITAVGGTEVFVGSAATPVVDVGKIGACVATGGGVLLAGNLQDVAANANITNIAHVKMIFLFMLFSLAVFSVHPMRIAHDDILHHFEVRYGWFYYPLGCNYCAGLSIIHSYGSRAFQRAVMLTNSTADAQAAQHGWALNDDRLAICIHHFSFL